MVAGAPSLSNAHTRNGVAPPHYTAIYVRCWSNWVRDDGKMLVSIAHSTVTEINNFFVIFFLF